MFTIVHESWLCQIQYSHHLPRPSDHNWLQLVVSTCQDIRTKLSGRVTTLPSLGRRPKPLHSAEMKLVSMLRNNPETTKVQLWHEQESAVILGPMSSEFYFMVNWEGFRKKKTCYKINTFKLKFTPAHTNRTNDFWSFTIQRNNDWVIWPQWQEVCLFRYV